MTNNRTEERRHMDDSEIGDEIRTGKPLKTTEQEYRLFYREALLRLAAKYSEWGDSIAMNIALSEVQRLDKEFGIASDLNIGR